MDQHFMELALNEARKAYELEEVPIGAVVVLNDRVIGAGYNLRESKQDPTLHAEIIAIREAARYLGSWRLQDCEIYVTIEPCPMCAGSILQARIKRVIFGARDPKAGCCGSLYNLLQDNRFNHRAEINEGVLEEQCAAIIKEFFKNKRK